MVEGTKTDEMISFYYIAVLLPLVFEQFSLSIMRSEKIITEKRSVSLFFLNPSLVGMIFDTILLLAPILFLH